MRFRHLWPALTLIVGLQSTAVWAQQLTPDQQRIQELERKLEDLDRRLKIAEAKTEGAPAPRTVAEAPPQALPAPVAQTGSQRPTNAGVAAGTIPPVTANEVGLVTVGPGGFTVQSGGGDFLLKIGADLQTDIRAFTGKSSSSLTDQILLRRVRPTFSGTVYKYIDYFIRPDFGQGSVIIYDIYAQINYIPHFSI